MAAVTHVIIESRDLDTDERARLTVHVEPAVEDHMQRAQLAALVAERHPDARLRSFSRGAATFLGRQHLIVASYSAQPARRSWSAQAEPAQDELFAA